MDPISLGKLQIHPEEINQNTGRIKIVSQTEEDVSHKISHTQKIPIDKVTQNPMLDTFTDLHRVWIPLLFLLSFLMLTIFVYKTQQKVSNLEQKLQAVEMLQTENKKEIQSDVGRIKDELSKNKIPQSEIDSKIEALNSSLKELKSSHQSVQKKIDSLNLKEVLIIEPEAAPAAPPAATEKQP
ncbi:MAG: hypothetical protein V4507_00575 [Verrucomicrobiota bacterium]